MNDKTTVSFVIYDYEGNFDGLSKKLNIEPSFVREQDENGEVRQWRLDSSADASDELEVHLTSLLEALAESAETIKQISSVSRCVVTAGIEYHQYNPEIVLEPQMLLSLSNLGVKLWIDIYNMWDGETDPPENDNPSKL
jgi:hypothetical protein